MTKLEAMLKYVSEYNDFYKRRIQEYGIKNPLDITQWPVLTRKELQENRFNMFSDGYKTKYHSQLLKRSFSSGTSGVPVNVYWDTNDYGRSVITLWRKRLEHYGIRPFDKLVKFTLPVYNIDFRNYSNQHVFSFLESNNTMLINRSCLQQEAHYKELITAIELFAPAWLYIQPFVLNNLLYYYKLFQKKLPQSVKYIESVGEMLSSRLREAATDYFRVPIANLYGSEEMNGIAFECKSRKMHILEENVLVELQTSDGIQSFGKGSAVITNLNNKAMPLIRYYQGDLISVSIESACCSCENKAPIVEIIHGRTRDSIRRNNTIITTYLLTEIIDYANNLLKDIIIQFRFVYLVNEDLMKCYLQLSNETHSWKRTVESSIKNGFETRGILDLELEFIYGQDHFEQEKTAKDVVFRVQK